MSRKPYIAYRATTDIYDIHVCLVDDGTFLTWVIMNEDDVIGTLSFDKRPNKSQITRAVKQELRSFFQERYKAVRQVKLEGLT
jgi:hypothetical protein